MICKEYESLSHIEKVSLIGAIVHAVQSDSSIFQMAMEMKRLATLKGLFDGVVINPTPEGDNKRETQY